MTNTLRAGRISGNPMNGLCERICIEVDRVFDGCMERVSGGNYVLTLSDIPPMAVPPFTFVSATGSGNATVENIQIETADAGRSLVEVDIIIPLTVIFADSLGARYSARSSLRLHREFLLTLPELSVVPYEIRVYASFDSRIGNFISADSVSVTGCYVLIAKVIVPSDVLVPIYGFCSYPECASPGNRTCNVFLNLPLFPD